MVGKAINADVELNLSDFQGHFVIDSDSKDKDYLIAKEGLKAIGSHISKPENEEMFANVQLTQDGNKTTFRDLLIDIAQKGDGEYFAKLFCLAKKYPGQKVTTLTRDYYNMAIDLETNFPGKVIRIGRISTRALEGETDIQSFGIALVEDGTVKKGIVVAPRTGDLTVKSSGKLFTVRN